MVCDGVWWWVLVCDGALWLSWVVTFCFTDPFLVKAISHNYCENTLITSKIKKSQSRKSVHQHEGSEAEKREVVLNHIEQCIVLIILNSV